MSSFKLCRLTTLQLEASLHKLVISFLVCFDSHAKHGARRLFQALRSPSPPPLPSLPASSVSRLVSSTLLSELLVSTLFDTTTVGAVELKTTAETRAEGVVSSLSDNKHHLKLVARSL